MRISYFKKEHNFGEGEIKPTSIQFTTPVFLPGNPTNENHATSKQYVDVVTSNNLDATNIISGVIDRNLKD